MSIPACSANLTAVKSASSSGVCRTHGDGRWFPGRAADLRDMVEGFLDQAKVPALEGRIVAAISPHAGFIYSGGVAGHTFRALRENARAGYAPDTIVVIGFTHREHFPGVALLDGAVIQTPIGPVPLDQDAAHFLADRDESIRLDSAPHAGEHSAENEIPFVQVALPGVPLIVALMGDHAQSVVTALLDALAALAQTRRLLLIASSDMLHNSDYEMVSQTDRATLTVLEKLDLDSLRQSWSPTHQPVCGIGPLSVVLSFARAEGAKRGAILCYRNSGDDYPESRGDWVVGYGSVAYAVDDN